MSLLVDDSAGIQGMRDYEACRKLRELCKLSVKQLADYLNIKADRIEKVESGGFSRVPSDYLNQISMVYMNHKDGLLKLKKNKFR